MKNKYNSIFSNVKNQTIQDFGEMNCGFTFKVYLDYRKLTDNELIVKTSIP